VAKGLDTCLEAWNMSGYYKIVYPASAKFSYETDPDLFVSSNASGRAEARYRIGHWTRPPEWLGKQGYGLMVFDNLNDLYSHHRNCFSWHGGSMVLRCIGGERIPLKPFLSMSDLYNGFIVKMESAKFPDGTIMLDELMPVGVIRRWHAREGCFYVNGQWRNYGP